MSSPRQVAQNSATHSVKSVVELWNIHDLNSEASSLQGSRTESLTRRWSRPLDRQAQLQASLRHDQHDHAQILGPPQGAPKLGMASQELRLMPTQPIAGDDALFDEPSNLSSDMALGATIERMACIPDAMNMAKDALVEQAVRMQTEMRVLLDKFEERLASHLDSHKEALDLAKHGLGTSKQTENAMKLRAESGHADPKTLTESLAQKDLVLSQGDASQADMGTATAADLQFPSAAAKQMFKKPTDLELGLPLPNATPNARERVATYSAKFHLAAQPDSIFTRITENDYFKAFVAFTIILNTVALGIQTDYDVVDSIEDRKGGHGWMEYLNRMFLIIFSLELIFRLLSERCYFFFGPFYNWNLFDTFMVLTAVFEEIFQDLGINVTFFRVVRVVRMTRTMRILRVFKVFRDLRVMISSILLSFKSLSWALFLLALLVFCFAILFCQAVAAHVDGKDFNQVANNVELREFYGTLPRAMFTLIMAISGGKDWYDLIIPLNDMSPVFSFLFVMYNLFVIFGMLNVLTGVFVDRASELSHMDRDLVVESEKFRVAQTRRALKNVFKEADENHSGYISWPEIMKYLKRDDVKLFLSTMEVSFEETEELFQMLDEDRQGRVSIDVFIDGCMRMKGHAKNLAVLHLQSDVEAIAKKLNSMHDELSVLVQSIAASGNVPFLSLPPMDVNVSTNAVDAEPLRM